MYFCRFLQCTWERGRNMWPGTIDSGRSCPWKWLFKTLSRIEQIRRNSGRGTGAQVITGKHNFFKVPGHLFLRLASFSFNFESSSFLPLFALPKLQVPMSYDWNALSRPSFCCFLSYTFCASHTASSRLAWPVMCWLFLPLALCMTCKASNKDRISRHLNRGRDLRQNGEQMWAYAITCFSFKTL